MVAKILNSNWPKAPGQYEGFKPLSGSALFAQMDHQRWHVQRKALAPAFGPGVINAQVKSLNKYLKVSESKVFHPSLSFILNVELRGSNNPAPARGCDANDLSFRSFIDPP